MSLSPVFSTKGFPDYYAAISNEPKDLKKSIKTSLNFHYGDATYEEFEKHHVPQDLGSRLIEAIPAFAYSVLVKTTYHIALALLNTVKGNFTLARSNIYALARDLQEAGGWFLKIFHDKLGSYVVQRSLFQKSCYELFEARQNQTPRSSKAVLIRNGITIPTWAYVLTLKSFKDMDDVDRADAIKDLGAVPVQANIEKLKLGEKDFFQRLDAASDKALGLLTFADLIAYPEYVPYALLSDDEFTSMKLSDIQGAQKFIGKRLKHFKSEELSSEPLKEGVEEITILELYNASGSVINNRLAEIPSKALCLLTEEQLPQLDLSRLAKRKIKALFGSFLAPESRKRFACLSGEQVQSMLLSLGAYLILVSKQQLSQLDLSVLKTKEEFRWLFGSNDSKEAKERFACLSGAQVQSMLLSLGAYLILVSKQQLPQLDLSVLKTKEEFGWLFGPDDSEEAKDRLACVQGISVVLPYLNDFQMKSLFDIQLASLDESKTQEWRPPFFPEVEIEEDTNSSGGIEEDYSSFHFDSNGILIMAPTKGERKIIRDENTVKMRLFGKDRMDAIKHLLDEGNQGLLDKVFEVESLS